MVERVGRDDHDTSIATQRNSVAVVVPAVAVAVAVAWDTNAI